jgi:hypothetical protein
MQRAARWVRRTTHLRSAVLALASAAALASAVWSTHAVLPVLEDWSDYYGPRDQAAREQEIELSLGFDVEVWERLRRSVRAGDRYAVVADGLDQHEVRNYAAYSLLPAIQVADVADANVVVYYATDPPPESPCTRIGGNVCVLRREEP